MERFTDSPDATLKLGSLMAEALPDTSVVSLNGTLGAGKSVLVRGVAAGLGVPPEDVTSPTFTLWQTYHGRRTLHHLDAYRLNSIDDFYDLGGEELFEMDGLKLIEWGDRVREALPEDYLQLSIEVVDDQIRRFVLTGVGQQAWPATVLNLGNGIWASQTS